MTAMAATASRQHTTANRSPLQLVLQEEEDIMVEAAAEGSSEVMEAVEESVVGESAVVTAEVEVSRPSGVVTWCSANSFVQVDAAAVAAVAVVVEAEADAVEIRSRVLSF